jgi:Ca2+-binding RTX toxin-like protein
VSFAATESSKVVTINVNGDTTVEPDEGFTVTLSNPVGATITTATALGTILNDDSGFDNVTVTAMKDNTLIQDATGSLSNGTGDIFVGQNANGNLVRRGLLGFDIAGNVPAGAVIQNVSLTMYVVQNPGGAQAVDLHRLLADWGEGGSSGKGNGGPAQTSDATWVHTFYDTQLWAAAGGDFSPTVSGSQTIGAPGTFSTWTSTAQMVADVQNWLDNPNTNYGWLLQTDESQSSSKEFASREATDALQRPVLTIEYSQGGAPTVSIDDIAITEGNKIAKAGQFTLTLSAPTSQPVTVSFATADGAAKAASDYQAATGTVTFAPNETTKNVTVNVNGDKMAEMDEEFFVVLSNATNATIARNQGVATILNNDAATVSIADVALAEGNSGTKEFLFTVTLDSAVDIPVSVDFFTADGTASSVDGDYVATSGTITFDGSAGETKTIAVTVNGDQTRESNESFSVNLANIQAAGRTVTIARDQGTGVIRNDDQAITLSPNGVLSIVGRDADDDVISFTTNASGTILVNYNGKNFGPYRVTRRIMADGLGGNDRIIVSGAIRLPARLDGGAGDDILSGGSRSNVLFGGDGNDVLRGGPGFDLLFGDSGDDVLFGEGGNDVLVGGDGDDRLEGGPGRNLLIGGLGTDILVGGVAEDILIGGTTVYDANNAALRAIMSEWNANRPFAMRTRRLNAGINSPTAGQIQLKRSTAPGDGLTVLDDQARDVLFGGWSSDWFLDFSPPDIVRDAASIDEL